MKFLLCNLIFLLVIHANFAQSIQGKLLDANTKETIVGANVFIANTSVGTVSNEKGEFLIPKSPQKNIDLIFSMTGYETLAIPILLDTLGNKPFVVFLKEKVDKIEGIVVKDKNPNWQTNYNIFKIHFLGETENAKNCIIKNPEILDFKFQRRIFNASADDMLIVENKNLGYIIKYKLSSFVIDFEKGYFVILGYPLFELMKGTKSQERKWKKRRLQTYLGSSLHLMRSLYQNNWEKSGFTLRRLERKPNPDRLPDSLIKAKLKKFLKENRQDSINYWIKKQKVSPIIEFLHNNPLKASDSLVTYVNDKLKRLTFSDNIQVKYLPEAGAYEKMQTSVITFFKPFVLLQEDGYVIETLDLIYEGRMPLKKVADLLPLDYQEGQ
ncbi:MAG: carboxypeptidase-like regulatory domain-containing protein [Raineya sp.]|jgi:hypothetical protein|nr:carboxypeptidase-like regulatory domain-containing protein [Raineya sp.]